MVATAQGRVVGRVRETEMVAAALAAGRSVLLEGPPGTGKTTLLRALAAGAGVPLELVEGNADLTPARLVGHHDPSRVLTEDYRPDNFVPGPLLRAMTVGGLLYVEELNRVPEDTLNVLLGVLSERATTVPRVGLVAAAPTFRLVAAMNPADAVGTGRVSPALHDRTCRVAVGYQDEAAERAVVAAVTGSPASGADPVPGLVLRAVRAVRDSRHHRDLRAGASVRGAVDLVAVARELATLRGAGADPERLGLDAALVALSGRVETEAGAIRTAEDVVADLWAGSAAVLVEPAEPPPGGDADVAPGADPGKA